MKPSVQIGDSIPPWEMASVSAARMRTMAAILRDPNPLHWDRQAVAALPFDLGERTINQGPLGLSYIVNMLHEWAGPGAIRKLTMTFPQVVLDEECVTARGEVYEVTKEDGVHLAHCNVRLEHAERGVLLAGTAVVVVPKDPH